MNWFRQIKKRSQICLLLALFVLSMGTTASAAESCHGACCGPEMPMPPSSTHAGPVDSCCGDGSQTACHLQTDEIQPTPAALLRSESHSTVEIHPLPVSQTCVATPDPMGSMKRSMIAVLPTGVPDPPVYLSLLVFLS